MSVSTEYPTIVYEWWGLSALSSDASDAMQLLLLFRPPALLTIVMHNYPISSSQLNFHFPLLSLLQLLWKGHDGHRRRWATHHQLGRGGLPTRLGHRAKDESSCLAPRAYAAQFARAPSRRIRFPVSYSTQPTLVVPNVRDGGKWCWRDQRLDYMVASSHNLAIEAICQGSSLCPKQYN